MAKQKEVGRSGAQETSNIKAGLKVIQRQLDLPEDLMRRIEADMELERFLRNLRDHGSGCIQTRARIILEGLERA